jgi:L-iditol 2-dehydrogenase
MKALVKFAKGPGNVEIRDVDDPPCGADQVKLEVSWCGICGTDLHVYHDTFRNFPPVILGHEMSATVVESGSKVQGLVRGDRFCILGASAVTCGGCFTAAGENSCSVRSGAGWVMGLTVLSLDTSWCGLTSLSGFRLTSHWKREPCVNRSRPPSMPCANLPRFELATRGAHLGSGTDGVALSETAVSGRVKTIVAGTDADLDSARRSYYS